MSGKKPRLFQWTVAKHTAAAILGTYAGTRSDALREASETVGSSVRTLQYWLKHPEFEKAVLSIRTELAKRAVSEAVGYSLAEHKARVGEVSELYDALRELQRTGGGDGIFDPVYNSKGEQVGVRLSGQMLSEMRQLVMSAHKMCADMDALASNAGDARLVTFVSGTSEA